MTPDSIIGGALSVHYKDDSSIIINDGFAEPMIKCYDIKNGKQLLSGVKRGIGPGEVMPPVRVTSSDDSLYILSISTKTLYSTGKDSISLIKRGSLPIEAVNLFYLPTAGLFVVPVLHFEGIDMDPGSVAYIYDSDFNKIQTIKGFATLWEEEKDLNDRILSKYHQISDVVEVGNKMVVLESHVLRIYDIDGGEINHNCDIELAPYAFDFSITEGSLTANTSLKPGYKVGAASMTAIGDKILISFNEAIKGQDDKDKIMLNLFDCTGQLIKKYEPAVNISPYPLYSKGNEIIMFTKETPDADVQIASGLIPNNH